MIEARANTPVRIAADDPADAVDAEGIQAVIVAEHMLDGGGAEIASDARNRADYQRAGGVDEARGRRDGDQTRDRAG